jgi:hypothetical protein
MSRFVSGVEEPLSFCFVFGAETVLLARFDVLDVVGSPTSSEESVILFHRCLHFLSVPSLNQKA